MRSRLESYVTVGIYARLTQLVECFPYKEEVGGSSPSSSTIKKGCDNMSLAVYAGSFDPFTIGHLSVYKKAAADFDDVVVVIARNAKKQRSFYSEQECAAVLERLGITHEIHDGLVVDICEQLGAKRIVRGIRNTTDFLYEEEIADANKFLAPNIETVYYRADNNISSSLVRLCKQEGRPFRELIP